MKTLFDVLRGDTVRIKDMIFVDHAGEQIDLRDKYLAARVSDYDMNGLIYEISNLTHPDHFLVDENCFFKMDFIPIPDMMSQEGEFVIEFEISRIVYVENLILKVDGIELTETSIIAGTTYELENIMITAVYTDEVEEEFDISAVTFRIKDDPDGNVYGSIADLIYQSLDGEDRDIIIECVFTEGEVSVVQPFTIHVLEELASLQIGDGSIEADDQTMYISNTFDLRTIEIFGKRVDTNLDDKVIDPADCIFTLGTGASGAISQLGVYSSIATIGDNVIDVSYTTGLGTVLTTTFNIHVIEPFTIFDLVPDNDTINGLNTYDLHDLIVRATYADASTVDIPVDDCIWSLAAGSSGVLDQATLIYTSIDEWASYAITCDYTNGIDFYTEDFTINIEGNIESLSIVDLNDPSFSSGCVGINAATIYDLSTLTVMGHYSTSSGVDSIVVDPSELTWALTQPVQYGEIVNNSAKTFRSGFDFGGYLAMMQTTIKVYTVINGEEISSNLTFKVIFEIDHIYWDPGTDIYRYLSVGTINLATEVIKAIFKDGENHGRGYGSGTSGVLTRQLAEGSFGTLLQAGDMPYTFDGNVGTVTFEAIVEDLLGTYQADLNLHISHEIDHLLLTPNPVEINVSSVYDLHNVVVEAVHVDGGVTNAIINVEDCIWAIKTGSTGSLNQGSLIYTSTGSAGTVFLNCSFTDELGVVFDVELEITVS